MWDELMSAQLARMTRAMRKVSSELGSLAETLDAAGSTETAKVIRGLAEFLSEERAARTLPPYNSFDRYRSEAKRTRKDALSQYEEITNATLGLAGEAGEVADLVKKKMFHGRALSRDEIGSELGDVLWYLDWLAEVFGLSLQEVADQNVDKLRKRYPDGFKLGGGNRS